MAAKYDFKTSPDIQGEKELPTLKPPPTYRERRNSPPCIRKL